MAHLQPDSRQIRQDLVICRARFVSLFSSPQLQEENCLSGRNCNPQTPIREPRCDIQKTLTWCKRAPNLSAKQSVTRFACHSIG